MPIESAPMKKPLTNKEAGAARKFYLDAEANELLDQASVAMGGIPVSNIVCALVRALSGVSARPSEEPVFTQLKRIFGREQFVAFKRAVSEALPKDAAPHIDQEHPEREPDFWTIGETGVYAFFNPNGENAGRVFVEATKLKAEYKLKQILVVAPIADITPTSLRVALEDAGILVVSISQLREIIAKPVKRAKSAQK